MATIVSGRALRLSAAGFMAALLSAQSGCGGDPTLPTLGKVSGKVTYQGKPVDAGHIVFTPAAGKGSETGQSATGEIGSGGSYNMTTFNTGDGAILGEHVVTVELRKAGEDAYPKPKADGTIDYKLPKSLGPVKYSKVESSPLRCTVVAGGTTFDIELKD